MILEDPFSQTIDFYSYHEKEVVLTLFNLYATRSKWKHMRGVVEYIGISKLTIRSERGGRYKIPKENIIAVKLYAPKGYRYRGICKEDHCEWKGELRDSEDDAKTDADFHKVLAGHWTQTRKVRKV